MKNSEVFCETGKPDDVAKNLGMTSKPLGASNAVSKKAKRKKKRKNITDLGNREISREDRGEQATKRLKVDSTDNQTCEQSTAGENVSHAIKKTKKKRKKKNSINKEDNVKQTDLEVNDEPNCKRLKKDTGYVEELSSAQVASASESFSENITSVVTTNKKKRKKKKKKKSKGGIPSGDTKACVKDEQLSSECISSIQILRAAANVELASKSGSENINEIRKKKRRRRQKKAVKNEGNGELQVISNKNNDPVDALQKEVSETINSTRENSNKGKKKKKKKVNSEVVTAGIAQENPQNKCPKKKKRKKKTVNTENGVLETVENGNDDSEVLCKTLNPRVENLIKGKFEKNNKSKQNKTKQKKKSKSASVGSLSVDGSKSIKHSNNLTTCEIITNTLPRLNRLYNDEGCKKEVTQCWNLQSNLEKENGFELLAKPFRCTYMPDFLQDSNVLQKVVEELSEIDLIKKNNDLYKFHQTPDLKNVSSPYISSLRKFLYGDFRKWLSNVTGIELNGTVDMGSSRYEYTDVLLCHDDELEGRRIAYILYLVPKWDKKDGGCLDLFNTDQNGLPKDIVKSLLPRWNTFAFFEVSPVSFHQVREVLSKDKVRLSINGWFHGSDIKRPPKYVEPPRPLLSPVHIEQDELYSWINPSYLDMDTQKTIRKKFQSDSEIELESFLCDEKYEELTSALQSIQLEWCKMGPANKQSLEILKQKNLPEIIKNCCKFFQSEALFLILSQLTGLKLHHLAPPDSDPDSDEEDDNKDSSPGMVIDICKWSHGHYTLMRDDQVDKTSSLDAMFFLHVADKWKLDYGGFTSYIAKDEDEELLTVAPHSNCLALVYRDQESLRFTKYVNASVKDLGEQNSIFYDISCTYFE